MSSPLALPVWADDDARYTNNSSVPLTRPRPPVTLAWSQYRGEGKVTFANPLAVALEPVVAVPPLPPVKPAPRACPPLPPTACA